MAAVDVVERRGRKQRLEMIPVWHRSGRSSEKAEIEPAILQRADAIDAGACVRVFEPFGSRGGRTADPLPPCVRVTVRREDIAEPAPHRDTRPPRSFRQTQGLACQYKAAQCKVDRCDRGRRCLCLRLTRKRIVEWSHEVA